LNLSCINAHIANNDSWILFIKYENQSPIKLNKQKMVYNIIYPSDRLIPPLEVETCSGRSIIPEIRVQEVTNIYIYIYRAKLEWNIKMRLQQKETSKCTWKIQDNDTSNACKMMHTSYWSVRTCMFLPRLYVPDPVRWSFGLLFGRL
jgi:hypothetical protein